LGLTVQSAWGLTLQSARGLTLQSAWGLTLQRAPTDAAGGGCNDDVAVIRKAFRMSVHAGQAAEYERRHNPIWRELQDMLIRHGVRTYSIYLDPCTNDLFAYVELDSEAQWAAIAHTDVSTLVALHERDHAGQSGRQPDLARTPRSVSRRVGVTFTYVTRARSSTA
jgi:L-rhamnose mutarotase